MKAPAKVIDQELRRLNYGFDFVRFVGRCRFGRKFSARVRLVAKRTEVVAQAAGCVELGARAAYVWWLRGCSTWNSTGRLGRVTNDSAPMIDH